MPINIFYKFIFCLTITLFFSTNVHAVESVQESKELKSPIANFNFSIESKTEKNVDDYSVNQHNGNIDNDENAQTNINLVSNENMGNAHFENNTYNSNIDQNNKFIFESVNKEFDDINSNDEKQQIILGNTNDTSNSLNTTYEDMNNSREKYSINNLKNISNENDSEKIIGIDNRIKVDNVFENPYKKIVMLEVKYKDGIFQGSGSLIRPNIVLTAAHNIYNRSLGGYPLETTVLAGLNKQKPSFGISKAIDYFVPKEWKKSEEIGSDYGIIRLNSNLGDKTGVFKVSTIQKLNEDVETAGYPGDKPQKTLYKTSGKLDGIYSDELQYKLDTFGGQSGSPVWNKNKEIIGIHIKGTEKYNYATRLTKNKLDLINNWIKEPYKEDYKKSVTLSREKISVWKDLTLKSKVPLTNIKLGNVYTAKHLFKHNNKQKYLSLYDGYNKFVGYFNKRDVTDFKPNKVHKNIKIINGNYLITKNLLKRNILGSTKKYLNKTLYAKTIYTLGNKQKVYSVYLNNKHLGFIDIRAAKVI